MAAPYSLDLRTRVVTAVVTGMSREEAAEHYQVSYSSVARWVVRAAAQGSTMASPMGGKKPFKLAAQGAAWLSQDIDLRGRPAV